MSNKKSLDVGSILARARRALGLKTNTELAHRLGVKQNTVSSWKTRGNIDLVGIIELCDHVNMDWLIFGKGEMTSDKDAGVIEKIMMMLEAMDEEGQRDILKHVQKEELLSTLRKERQVGGVLK